MKLNRREWLRTSALAGGFTLLNSFSAFEPLTEEEIKKFNPRRLENPIRLSSNENPYGPSQKVRDAVKSAFNDGCRYPYEYADELAKMLATKHGVPKESIIKLVF